MPGVWGELERVSLLRRAADLRARLMLCDLGETCKDKEGLNLLLHAEIYLSDRLMYEVDRRAAISEKLAAALSTLQVRRASRG